MKFQKGNKFGKKITPEIANEYRDRGLIVRRDNKARNEWFEDYTDLALTLAAMEVNEFERHFAHPETKREEILLCRFSDPTTAYFTLKDFQDRVQGTPTKKAETTLKTDGGLNIKVESKEMAEAIENLVR